VITAQLHRWSLVACLAVAWTLQAEPLPKPNLEHLAHLSDNRGISEFARGYTPLQARFCIEDTARALVAVLRIHHTNPDPRTADLARTYLQAITGLRNPKGGFYFGYQSQDGPIAKQATGDQLGRLIWGLGEAVAQGVDEPMKAQAENLLREALANFNPASASPLELSYTLQGLHAYVQARPTKQALGILRTSADRLAHLLPSEGAWVWPNNRVTYDSGRLPLALLLAAESLDDPSLRATGLRVLRFLESANFPDSNGPLHVIGNAGWWQRDQTPAVNDQQPIDASGLVEAYAAAWRATQDTHWLRRAEVATAWFLGRNDSEKAVYETATGACHDAIGHHAMNANCGAESTISALIALTTAQTLPIR